MKCLWSLVTFGSSIRVGLARLGGVEIVTRELNTWEDDDDDSSNRRYLLEILTALTTIPESRRVLVHNGGLRSFSSKRCVERESLSRYWVDRWY